jgi:aspartyl-tRNA(Asn)/glutamyl-tRNA(Gln) amidotransferase subunit A
VHNKSIKELANGLRSGEFSSVELTQAFLARIKQHQSLNCFISVTEDLALQAAKLSDDRIAKGNADLLTGIPIAQKDIFCTQGVKTSCGSKTKRCRRSHVR